MNRAACAFADWYTRWSRAPITILLLTPTGLAVLAGGWAIGQFSAAMLALTTILSFDASLMSRCVALKQGQDAGEVDTTVNS